tara:strand:+ start:128 stop:997 length:870 start_codon:yes stop_codon:yes gene_type:complete
VFKIGTFYKCFEFLRYQELEDGLRDHCTKRKIKGTIILTPEGINATVSSEKDNALEDLNLYLNNLIEDVKFRFSFSKTSPFKRLKIKTRKELVPSGTDGKSFNHKSKYLTPKEWQSFIEDSKNIIIDVRNDYESKVGTFRNSISPNTKNFREFKDFLKENKKKFKDKNIGIFCTGGIRCEKALHSFQKEGLYNICQLQGGILNFLSQSTDKSSWDGDCFVFDERVTVTKDLSPGEFKQCYACRRPLSKNDLKRREYNKGISCHNCFFEKSESDRIRYAERQKQFDMKKS